MLHFGPFSSALFSRPAGSHDRRVSRCQTSTGRLGAKGAAIDRGGRSHTQGSHGHIGTPRKRRQAGSPTDGSEIFRQRVYNINTGVRCFIRRGRVLGRAGPGFRIGRPSCRNGKPSFRIGKPNIRIAKPNIRTDARVAGLTGPIFGFHPAGNSDRSASSVCFRYPAVRVAKASVQEGATLGHLFKTSYSLWVPCYRCRCCLARPSVDDGPSAL